MNGQVNNIEHEFLWKLLANPADPDYSYIFNLQSLIIDFPQSGALRALLMPHGDKLNLKHAAAYFTPAILHKLATAPDSLPIVSPGQIIFNDELPPAAADPHFNIPVTEQETNNYAAAENAIEYADEALIRPEIEKNDAPVAKEENELAKAYNDYLTESEAYPTEPVSSYGDDEVRYFHQEIDDEVYDEIVSIEDIGLEQLAILNKSAQEEEKNAESARMKAKENYFVFEPGIAGTGNEKTEEPQQASGIRDPYPAIIGEEKTDTYNKAANGQAKSDVSRYNDEKMPYTFMWWLDKTRKEHANVYQPYVSRSTPVAKPKNKGVVDELQQQYYQNIVSISSITELDKDLPKTPAPQPRKEDKIIERFIHEEPQIKHPSGMKLDNENKAKRSSEDKEELVTETLARIYTEQMLYHKAILTYKKLMLKFPEKSLYFAGQIEQLESKIN